MATIRAIMISALLLTACETTRDNNDKVSTRALYCNVPDRCGVTP